MLFNPGTIVATPSVLEMVEQGLHLSAYLYRHLSGDWGELCPEDVEENNLSLHNGFRLLSSYSTPFGKLWIITEADRSITTLLLPSEY